MPEYRRKSRTAKSADQSTRKSSPSSLPSEHAEQVTLINEFRRRWPSVLIFAIPNGGYRSEREGSKLKAEGVVPGVPDLYIPQWRTWVEMKRQKGGRLSKEQKEVIAYLDSIGDTVIIGKGWVDAMRQLKGSDESSMEGAGE